MTVQHGGAAPGRRSPTRGRPRTRWQCSPSTLADSRTPPAARQGRWEGFAVPASPRHAVLGTVSLHSGSRCARCTRRPSVHHAIQRPSAATTSRTSRPPWKPVPPGSRHAASTAPSLVSASTDTQHSPDNPAKVLHIRQRILPQLLFKRSGKNDATRHAAPAAKPWVIPQKTPNTTTPC